MSDIPSDGRLDSTLSLLSEGYTFVSTRCRRYRSDIFRTRLMLQPAICVQGEGAARMFYEGDRFTRQGAMPRMTLLLLQDKGSVQQLDGEAHRWRKRMFMSLMTPEAIRDLSDTMADHWRAAIVGWERMDKAVLHPEVQEILCRSVCAWAGIPLADEKARQRTREFAAMIDGSGSAGPRNWKGLLLRARTERWIRRFLGKVRRGTLQVPEGSAAHVIAWHRDPDGKLLDTTVAGVEMLNVLRPTVAIARFVTFAALALHEHPECREKLRDGEDGYLDLFVQEVRRFYPFFPLVGGRARSDFTWNGHRFARGDWVILDLYGTDHDPRIWEGPEAFRPERFRQWDGSAFNFIPQGAGGYETGHRCPGEWITIELMKRAVTLLVTAMSYDVPPQDLSIDLARMPAIPNSRFIITNVRAIR